MLVLTEDALLVCAHELGEVGVAPRQDWVTVNGRKVLVDSDPESRPITKCPNIGVAILSAWVGSAFASTRCAAEPTARRPVSSSTMCASRGRILSMGMHE